jgi:hypothetical protein
VLFARNLWPRRLEALGRPAPPDTLRTKVLKWRSKVTVLPDVSNNFDRSMGKRLWWFLGTAGGLISAPYLAAALFGCTACLQSGVFRPGDLYWLGFVLIGYVWLRSSIDLCEDVIDCIVWFRPRSWLKFAASPDIREDVQPVDDLRVPSKFGIRAIENVGLTESFLIAVPAFLIGWRMVKRCAICTQGYSWERNECDLLILLLGLCAASIVQRNGFRVPPLVYRLFGVRRWNIPTDKNKP